VGDLILLRSAHSRDETELATLFQLHRHPARHILLDGVIPWGRQGSTTFVWGSPAQVAAAITSVEGDDDGITIMNSSSQL
jgi:hypothetical protein